MNSVGEFDEVLFANAYQALRAALVSELKKQGLWDAPPSYLGIYGWARWSDQSDEGGFSSEALDELLPECYHFIFIRRLRSLRNQLAVKGNIDGLIFLGIRNFLHDTQRKYDPLGYRIYELVRTAIRSLLDGELLFVLSGRGKITNESLLGFSRDLSEEAGVEAVELQARIVPSWSDDLLPSLLVAQGAALEAVLKRLELRLLGLAEHGIEAFRLKHLLEPFKKDVRVRWGALFDRTRGPMAFEDSDQETSLLVPIVGPDVAVEERDAFHKLFLDVASAIDLEEEIRTRQYLQTLWGFLRVYAETGSDRLPSHRKLSKQLKIPRERLTGLFATLAELIHRQKSAKSSSMVVIGE